MTLFEHTRISTRVFVGFGVILLLLVLIAVIGMVSLVRANIVFREYRSLARQTNAAGRVQANMLMTRIYAKNFVIEPTEEHIQGVRERARATLDLVEQGRAFTTRPDFLRIVDRVDEQLTAYIASFETVAKLQAQRDVIVKEQLNVVGPQTERDLTAIMRSAEEDGDVEAAFLGGITLRNLLLARLYAQRFLIQNDEASYTRVLEEFQELNKAHAKLETSLEDPERRKLAWGARRDAEAYERAVDEVHTVINERNEIILGTLDRIGPEVASEIEGIKLAIKAEQDALGPRAEADLGRAKNVALIASVLAIAAGLVLAALIGRGISRPVQTMTGTMKELAAGNVEVHVGHTHRRDEVGQMALAVEVFRESMAAKRQHEAERQRAAEEVRKAKEAAEAANESLDEKNTMLEALSGKLSKYLSPQVYESIFTGSSDVVLRTERKKLTVYSSDIKDFTQTTSDMQPEDLASLLNEYFSEMSKIALEHGGTIDKFVGDAMLVFFGDPHTRGVAEDARACVRMAIAMQRRMRDLQAVWHARGFTKPFHMRIGINTGLCNVGNFGSNERMDYTIIGGEVNPAARLESQADPDGILMSYETYANVQDLVQVEERPSLVAKGVSRDVRPFAVQNIFEDFEHERRVLRQEADGMYVMIDLEQLQGEAREKALASMRVIVRRLEGESDPAAPRLT